MVESFLFLVPQAVVDRRYAEATWAGVTFQDKDKQEWKCPSHISSVSAVVFCVHCCA